jgi:hypothetical protein
VSSWIAENKADSLSALGAFVGIGLTIASSELAIPVMAIVGVGTVAVTTLARLVEFKRESRIEKVESKLDQAPKKQQPTP